MNKFIVLNSLLLSLLSGLCAQDFKAHGGLVVLGGRGVSTKISPTNRGGTSDKYQMIRPTYFTAMVIGQNDDKGVYWNFRGVNFGYYVFAHKDPKRYNDVRFPSQRTTYNSNRTATDFSILTNDLYGYFWGNRVKFGLGFSFQWNAEGVTLNDIGANTITNDRYRTNPKLGSSGLGSGVYRMRYRLYAGIGPGIKTSFDEGRIQLALNTSLGPYTGGGMLVAELIASYAFTENFGFMTSIATRRKNFKEYELLPEVIVQTNDLNFGFWMDIDKKK